MCKQTLKSRKDVSAILNDYNFYTKKLGENSSKLIFSTMAASWAIHSGRIFSEIWPILTFISCGLYFASLSTATFTAAISSKSLYEDLDILTDEELERRHDSNKSTFPYNCFLNHTIPAWLFVTNLLFPASAIVFLIIGAVKL